MSHSSYELLQEFSFSHVSNLAACGIQSAAACMFTYVYHVVIILRLLHLHATLGLLCPKDANTQSGKMILAPVNALIVWLSGRF